jgi:hypothetical protein
VSCEFPLYLPIGDMENDGFIAVPRRPLTTQEVEWVTEIVLISPQWADVSLGSLYVIGECASEPRSVVFEKPEQPQTPLLAGHQGLVGEIDLAILHGGKKEPLTILLHYADGSLSLLEVIWYNFPEPIPQTWNVVSREVRPGR